MNCDVIPSESRPEIYHTEYSSEPQTALSPPADEAITRSRHVCSAENYLLITGCVSARPENVLTSQRRYAEQKNQNTNVWILQKCFPVKFWDSPMNSQGPEHASGCRHPRGGLGGWGSKVALGGGPPWTWDVVLFTLRRHLKQMHFVTPTRTSGKFI